MTPEFFPQDFRVNADADVNWDRKRYKEEPEIAPSRAQYRKILQRRGQLSNEKVKDEESNADNEISILTAEESDLLRKSYFKHVLYCFKIVSFVFLNICYGVNTAVYYEIGTLLNAIVAEYFPRTRNNDHNDDYFQSL
ncbi:hypothetical protein ACTXT7_013104 [Hymenolepis weldensis]